MPQLDMVSWFHQVFSTLIVISIFYLALSLKFLPALTSMIKGRYKLQLFRKYCIQFFSLQTTVLKQQTFNNLSVLSVNSLVLINSFFAPLFDTQLTKNLTHICYQSVNMDQVMEEPIYEDGLDFADLETLVESDDLNFNYLQQVQEYLEIDYNLHLEHTLAEEDCELLDDTEGLSLAATATYF